MAPLLDQLHTHNANHGPSTRLHWLLGELRESPTGWPLRDLRKRHMAKHRVHRNTAMGDFEALEGHPSVRVEEKAGRKWVSYVGGA